ncbi:hypothetical protein LTR53_004813 [Teratosphaeriaceae sp. CCFEE 6253]|nr:hypothetical protein LTR53_004813 [Teratosphaeriaceae sp. CCFEE 6253]
MDLALAMNGVSMYGTSRAHDVMMSRFTVMRDPFTGMFVTADGAAFAFREQAMAHQVWLDDFADGMSGGFFYLVGWAPCMAIHLKWMSQAQYMIWQQYQQAIMSQHLSADQRRTMLIQMIQQSSTTTTTTEANQLADRMLGMEGDLHANKYGYVEQTTTTTTTTSSNQGQSQAPANDGMSVMRSEFADHFIMTSTQNGVPTADIQKIVKNIRGGKSDQLVLAHHEKVRTGQVVAARPPPPPTQQMQIAPPPPSTPQPQCAAQPQRTPQPRGQGSYQQSTTSYQQSAASPAPQYTYPQAPVPRTPAPQAPVYQQQVAPPTPMYGSQHVTTTQTTTVQSTSTSTGAQSYAQPAHGAHPGYAQQQQQLPAHQAQQHLTQGQQYPGSPQPVYQYPAQPAPMQLTQGPHDPNSVANFNQQSEQYPGSPQPEYATQRYADSPRPAASNSGVQDWLEQTEEDLRSPYYEGYDQYEQGYEEAQEALVKEKKKKKKSSSSRR